MIWLRKKKRFTASPSLLFSEPDHGLHYPHAKAVRLEDEGFNPIVESEITGSRFATTMTPTATPWRMNADVGGRPQHQVSERRPTSDSYDLTRGRKNLRHTGGCHCGNIELTFESNIDPTQIKVRSCQCSFCRKHGARAVSDPSGMLTVRIAEKKCLIKYLFAHRTAEFFICRECGVFVAAVTVGIDEQRAVAQLNAITEDQQFGHAVAVDFSHESRAERIQRRRDVWMPVSIEIS